MISDQDILFWEIGTFFGWISVVLIALSIIPQTIKTVKTKDNNFGTLVTFSIYLFSALCYFIASLLLLLWKEQWYRTCPWFWTFCLAPIVLNTIGPICATTIIISIVKSMYKTKKTWQMCKNDISCWVVDYKRVKEAKGFAKIVLFFRTKLGFILIFLFLLAALLITVSLFFVKPPNAAAEQLTKTQLIILLIANSAGAITWTIINWPLFFSSIERKEIANISLWYILFNAISSLTLLVYGIVVMQQVGWEPITIFACIFNGSGSSFLILYRKIKSLSKKNEQLI